MIIDAPAPLAPHFSYEQFYERQEQTRQFIDGRTQMLEHLKKQMEILKSKGISHAYHEAGDEVTLCWFDKNARNSLSIWPEDCDGVWNAVEKGKTVDEIDFANLNDFLKFSVRV